MTAFNSPEVFDIEKAKKFALLVAARERLAKLKERLVKKGVKITIHPYTTAVEIQRAQNEIKVLMAELKPHAVT